MADLEARVRALAGRTVTVTLAGVESEPYPITGRVGHINPGTYFDLLDVAGRDRPTVRIRFDLIDTIAPAE